MQFVVLLALLLLSTGSHSLDGAVPVQALPDKEIIDMHCHVAGVGAGGSGCFVSDRLGRNIRFPIFLRSFGVRSKDMKREGDALVALRLAGRVAESRSVGKVVVLAMDGVVDVQGNLDRTRTEIYIPNDYVAGLAEKHPEILFGASVNPLRADALERLEWASRKGAVLVKWLPAIQDIDPSDPRLIPFYRKLVELGLPLLTHAGNEHAFTSANNRLSDPELLRLPASLGVTLIVAHAAVPGTYAGESGLERLCRLARQYPSVYVDISSLTQINKRRALRSILKRAELQGRLVYGTDYPLITVPGMTPCWVFAGSIGPWQAWKISRIKNPWDRDVALKIALGVPPDVFLRFPKLISKRDRALFSGLPAAR